MKRVIPIAFICLLFLIADNCIAQCSVCTKTALQMGEKPAKGLNQGILYLMFTPLIIMGFIGYRWWKNEQAQNKDTYPSQ